MASNNDNPYAENFALISLILLKSPDSRSYDDILCLRSFIYKFEWIKEFFKHVVHLGLVNDFCRSVCLGEFNQGQVMHRQGEIGDKIYFMIEGNVELILKYRVDLTKDEYEERERIEHRIQSGMTFGDEVMSLQDSRPNTAICVSPIAYCMTISKSSIRLLAKELKLDAQTAGQPEQYRPDTKNFIMSVLSKARVWRNDAEIDSVAKYLKQRIPFFDKFSIDQQQELCRIAETISLKDQTILFKQGQVGQAFYIVLHGSVDVYVAGTKETKEQQARDGAGSTTGSVAGSVAGSVVGSTAPAPTSPTGSIHSHQSSVGNSSVHSGGPSVASHRSGNSHHSNVEGYGKLVHTIPEGETFGDRALESASSLRTATVVSCVGLTELLVIYKEDYHNIVSVINQKASMDKIVLLRKNPIFKNTDMLILKALAKVMSPRTYQLDEVLYYEGEKAMNMIIVAIGECIAEIQVFSEREIYSKPIPHYLSPKTKTVSNSSRSNGAETKRASSPRATEAESGKLTSGRADEAPIDAVSTARSIGSLGDLLSMGSSSQLTRSVISKQRAGGTVQVGRLGQSSILAPFVAVCESIMDEVYHRETVRANTLVQAYVVFKNDFIHHIQEPIRSELRKLLKNSPNYLMPDLWDLHTKQMGEKEWKSKRAWDLFKKDIRSGKASSITSKLNVLQNVHRTDAMGNRLPNGDSIAKETNVKTNSKLASTLAGFTEAFLTRSSFERAQIKKITSSFSSDKLVDVEIKAAKRRDEEKQLHETIVSQPDLKKHNSYIPPESKQQEHTFGLSRSTVVYPAGMAEVLSHQNDPEVSITEAEAVVDPSSYIQAKSLVGTSTYPLVQLPYALIHVHRENIATDNKAIQPRVTYCYYRISGMMRSVIEVKSCAARQMRNAYIDCLTHDTDIDQPEILLDWKTFISFDTIGVSNTDFFIAYFRSVPMEFASFTPKVNLLNKSFPAECKSSGQRFACVKFNKVTSFGVDDQFRDMLKPKYLQELGILREMLASSFTLAECCKYLLLNSEEGREIRLKQQRLYEGGNGSPINGRHSPDARSISEASAPQRLGRQKSTGMLMRQDSGMGTVHGSLDDDYDDEQTEPEKHCVTCVVPLYQWISMAPESFESMTLNSLLFHQSSDEIPIIATDLSKDYKAVDEFESNKMDEDDTNDPLAKARQVATASAGSIRTMSELKYSLREAGLLPLHEDDHEVSDTDIIERAAIKRHRDGLKDTPGVKLTEEQTVRLDMLQVVDLNGKTHHPHTKGDLGQSTRAKAVQSNLLKPPRMTTRHANHRGVTGLSVYEEGLLEEERANILKLVANARDHVVRMNDDFCYNELYTSLEMRKRRGRFTTAAHPRISDAEANEVWSPTNLLEQNRKLRVELEQQGKSERFRHNPVVRVGVDRGAAEGHLALLESMVSLPTHSKLMAQKKDEVHLQVKSLHNSHPPQSPTITKAASTSILGTLRGPHDYKPGTTSHGNMVGSLSNSGIIGAAGAAITSSSNGMNAANTKRKTLATSTSLPVIHGGATTLSQRLDILHDVLNDSIH